MQLRNEILQRGKGQGLVQVGCLREIRNNGEIGIRSIDAKITQTTNPIVNI